ncbi:hypothetical protein JCM10212_005243 [Sporobolomyces blumeae]
MALVTLSGYPCSGKTTRAHQLERYLSHRLALPDCPPALKLAKVKVINDESLSLAKSVYDDGRAEKPARAALFSAMQRFLGPDTIVIVDAMNYIKGSRYQMYCQAREVQVRNCTVFVATPPDRCRAWDAARTGGYAPATLDNLISRFEEPASTARWDSPLVTVACDDAALDTGVPSEPADAGASAEWREEMGTKEAQAIWDALTNAELKPANLATKVINTSSTSYLTMLEQTTSSVVAAILSAQALSPLSGPTPLLLSASSSSPSTSSALSSREAKLSIDLRKPVSMPQLQRYKRQFVTMNKGAGGGTELDRDRVAGLFVTYLETQLR